MLNFTPPPSPLRRLRLQKLQLADMMGMQARGSTLSRSFNRPLQAKTMQARQLSPALCRLSPSGASGGSHNGAQHKTANTGLTLGETELPHHHHHHSSKAMLASSSRGLSSKGRQLAMHQYAQRVAASTTEVTHESAFTLHHATNQQCIYCAGSSPMLIYDACHITAWYVCGCAIRHTCPCNWLLNWRPDLSGDLPTTGDRSSCPGPEDSLPGYPRRLFRGGRP